MQQTNDNFQLEAPKPVDHRIMRLNGEIYTIYTSVLEANTLIPSSVRYQTLLVPILKDGQPKLHWYKDGTADNQLVEYVIDIPPTGGFKAVNPVDLNGNNEYLWVMKTYTTYRLMDNISLDTTQKYFKIPNPSTIADHTVINLAYGGGLWKLITFTETSKIIPLNNINDSIFQSEYIFDKKGLYQFYVYGGYLYQTSFGTENFEPPIGNEVKSFKLKVTSNGNSDGTDHIDGYVAAGPSITWPSLIGTRLEMISKSGTNIVDFDNDHSVIFTSSTGKLDASNIGGFFDTETLIIFYK